VQGQIYEKRSASENVPLLTFLTVETLRQIKIILLKVCIGIIGIKHTVYNWSYRVLDLL